jgi:hypothetical protein
LDAINAEGIELPRRLGFGGALSLSLPATLGARPPDAALPDEPVGFDSGIGILRLQVLSESSPTGEVHGHWNPSFPS